MSYRARVAVAIAFVLAGAAALAVADDHVSLVPWKVVVSEDGLDAPLTLFWIPASSEELRHSELLTSTELTLFSSRCVAMRVVQFDNGVRLARLKIGEELPVAVLVERGGRVIGRVDAEHGALSLTKVEELVRDAINEREGRAEASLDEARRRAEAGETDAAMAIYGSLWEQRCVCPRQGRDAKRAMRKMRK